MPHSNCDSNGDLYASYSAVRGDVAIAKEELLGITDTGGRQSCTNWGLHTKLTAVQTMFADGDAAFFANIGALAEPVNKAEFKAKTKALPNSLFAHNAQQFTAANLHADSRTAKGVLGRMAHVLSSGTGHYKVGQYSISGNQKILEGDGEVAKIVGRRNGIEQFRYYSDVGRRMANLSSVRASSVFAEQYASLLERAFSESEGLGSILGTANITNEYVGANDADSKLCEQFMWVAKLIDLRTHALLKAERDSFYVELGGFDTHSDVRDVLNVKLDEVNRCLGAFVDEMKRKGTWENVAIVTLSDFGRTLTSNGRGTDHAWGGNQMILGGSVRGGQIFGKYPTDFEPLNVGRGRLIPTTPYVSARATLTRAPWPPLRHPELCEGRVEGVWRRRRRRRSGGLMDTRTHTRSDPSVICYLFHRSAPLARI